jgi:predicted YcjX-like family ATPase
LHLDPDAAQSQSGALPHIRLDRAMDFLLGDKLA